MSESWDTSRIDIGEIIDWAGSILETLSAIVPLQVVLAVAVGATAMVGWWLIRKLVRLAFYAGIVAFAAWLWYFGVPG